jgi:hypothetical protein
MASVISKMINGKPYYYLAVSARVDGKPRIVEQKYLGSAEDIEAAMDHDSPEMTSHYARLHDTALDEKRPQRLIPAVVHLVGRSEELHPPTLW